MHCEGCIAPVPMGKDRWKGYVCRGVLRLGLGLHRLPRIHLLGRSCIRARRRAGTLRPRPLLEVAKRSSYCSGLRYVCSPAFRIASMPSSALSKVVVLEDFTCPGEMAAKTVAAAVLSSGAS